MNAVEKTIAAALLLCLFSSLYSCSSESIDENEITPRALVEYVSIEQEILSRINTYRSNKALPPLEILDNVSQLAQSHNDHMISEKEICHHFFNERQEEIKLKNKAIIVGENVGFGHETAEEIVDGWIASEAHRKNIEGDFNHMGISAKKNAEGDYYFTNILVKL
ncbi:CAP domain-containing protein [Joostella atrarenae]|uniref:CAP domain-containing protein n=1 Tax=Joostella atrarenae TaxID=679257 RepID=A0ABS9J2M7_9FLAO|nr:CAP domain-containing protein [Joostella atrarenae]MCF8714644.1 CAP domain-containing protein [Joostella atrarenae]